VLSNELFNQKSETAIVMAITSQQQRAGFPLTFALPAGALPKPSWLKISRVRTVSIERLGKKVAGLDLDTLNRALDGLLELIG
jgi:mRNA interferase MazF